MRKRRERKRVKIVVIVGVPEYRATIAHHVTKDGLVLEVAAARALPPRSSANHATGRSRFRTC